MSRSRWCAVVALCATCLALLSPQPTAAVTGRPRGQAIQFGIGGDFTLRDFGGATLSYQRFVSRDAAWRVSVGLYLDYDDVEHSEEFVGDDVVDETMDQREWLHRVSVAGE